MDVNRRTAMEVLLHMEKNDSYSNLLLNDFIEKYEPPNQGFVRELVYGVLKYKIQLDYILNYLIVNGIKKTKKQDLILLRMGIYQLRYMNSVPEYAAVNETVNLAKKFCKGRESFINGVLRGYIRKKDDIIFPNREKDEKEYLSVKYSVSTWIVELWIKVYGVEETEKLLLASNVTPSLSIRANLLKNSPEKLMSELEKEGFEVITSKISPRCLLVKGSSVLDSKLFKNGCFSVQDEASAKAADVVMAKKGDFVIDVCAAPGGKTFAIAEAMENTGKIIAMDVYEHRLELIKNNSKKLGITIVETLEHDGRRAVLKYAEKADCVLADVPCSGLGVLRRKPEIKYKENVDLKELTDRQARILRAAATYVKKGGALVYSTCTVNPDENQLIAEAFAKENNEFIIEQMKQYLPTEGTDGFFICRMVKL